MESKDTSFRITRLSRFFELTVISGLWLLSTAPLAPLSRYLVRARSERFITTMVTMTATVIIPVKLPNMTTTRVFSEPLAVALEVNTSISTVMLDDSRGTPWSVTTTVTRYKPVSSAVSERLRMSSPLMLSMPNVSPFRCPVTWPSVRAGTLCCPAAMWNWNWALTPTSTSRAIATMIIVPGAVPWGTEKDELVGTGDTISGGLSFVSVTSTTTTAELLSDGWPLSATHTLNSYCGRVSLSSDIVVRSTPSVDRSSARLPCPVVSSM